MRRQVDFSSAEAFLKSRSPSLSLKKTTLNSLRTRPATFVLILDILLRRGGRGTILNHTITINSLLNFNTEIVNPLSCFRFRNTRSHPTIVKPRPSVILGRELLYTEQLLSCHHLPFSSKPNMGEYNNKIILNKT